MALVGDKTLRRGKTFGKYRKTGMEQHQPPSTTKVNYYELNQTLLKSNTNILDKATYSQDNRVTGRRTSISTPAEETHIDSRDITRVTPK